MYGDPAQTQAYLYLNALMFFSLSSAFAQKFDPSDLLYSFVITNVGVHSVFIHIYTVYPTLNDICYTPAGFITICQSFPLFLD